MSLPPRRWKAKGVAASATTNFSVPAFYLKKIQSIFSWFIPVNFCLTCKFANEYSVGFLEYCFLSSTWSKQAYNILPWLLEANGYSSQFLPVFFFSFGQPESRMFFAIWRLSVMRFKREGLPILMAALMLAQTVFMREQGNVTVGHRCRSSRNNSLSSVSSYKSKEIDRKNKLLSLGLWWRTDYGSSPVACTGSIRDDPYLNSKKTSLAMMELSSRAIYNIYS